MGRMWQGFASYAAIGVANTLIHWQLFFILRNAYELSQMLSNFLAFCAAASFSFYANSLFTFLVPATVTRYLEFMLVIGSMSLAVGWIADKWSLPGLATVTVFSLSSLIGGFVLSKWLLSRGHAS